MFRTLGEPTDTSDLRDTVGMWTTRRSAPPGTRAGRVQGRHARRHGRLVTSSWFIVAVLFAVSSPPRWRREGRPRRAEVRRRLRVRGALLPLGPAPRGVPRRSGEALRDPGALDHPLLLRRHHGDRGRGGSPGQEFGSRSSVRSPRWPWAVRCSLLFVVPDGLLHLAVGASPPPTSWSASSTWSQACRSTEAGCSSARLAGRATGTAHDRRRLGAVG